MKLKVAHLLLSASALALSTQMNLAMSMPVNATGLAVRAGIPSQADDGITNIDRRLVDKSDLVEDAWKGTKKIFGKKKHDTPRKMKTQEALEKWNRYKHNVLMAKHRPHSRFKASHHGHDQHQPRAIESSEDGALHGDMIDKRLVALSWEDIRKKIHKSKEEKVKDMEKKIQDQEKQQRQNKFQQWAATKGVSPYKRGQDEVSESRDFDEDESAAHVDKRLVDMSSTLKHGFKTMGKKVFKSGKEKALEMERKKKKKAMRSKQPSFVWKAEEKARKDDDKHRHHHRRGQHDSSDTVFDEDLFVRDEIEKRLVDVASMKAGLRGVRKKYLGKTPQELAAEDRFRAQLLASKKYKQAQQDAWSAKYGQPQAVRSDAESRGDDLQRRLVDKDSLIVSGLKGWRAKTFGKTKKEEAEDMRRWAAAKEHRKKFEEWIAKHPKKKLLLDRDVAQLEPRVMDSIEQDLVDDDDFAKRLVDKSSLLKSGLKNLRLKVFGKTRKEKMNELRIQEEARVAEKIRLEKIANWHAKHGGKAKSIRRRDDDVAKRLVDKSSTVKSGLKRWRKKIYKTKKEKAEEKKMKEEAEEVERIKQQKAAELYAKKGKAVIVGRDAAQHRSDDLASGDDLYKRWVDKSELVESGLTRMRKKIFGLNKKEKAEKARLEKERLEKEQANKARVAKERLDADRIRKEMAERKRLKNLDLQHRSMNQGGYIDDDSQRRAMDSTSSEHHLAVHFDKRGRFKTGLFKSDAAKLAWKGLQKKAKVKAQKTAKWKAEAKAVQKYRHDPYAWEASGKPPPPGEGGRLLTPSEAVRFGESGPGGWFDFDKRVDLDKRLVDKSALAESALAKFKKKYFVSKKPKAEKARIKQEQLLKESIKWTEERKKHGSMWNIG